MKVTALPQPPQFEPVVITLESRWELDLMIEILAPYNGLVSGALKKQLEAARV